MSKYYKVEGVETALVFSGLCNGKTCGEVKKVLNSIPSIDIVCCSECVYCNVQNTKYLYAICERHGIEFKPFEDDTRTHGCAWGINSSENPNNCEHITEDGVTCAKYPACDDCLDNPLNKVKGSERLVKGKDEPQTCSVNGRPYDCGNCEYFKCTADEPQTEEPSFTATDFGKGTITRYTDEPQTEREGE